MKRFSTPARLRAFILVSALGAALAVPVAVSADTIPNPGGVAHIMVAPEAPVLGKVAATLDLSFTCDPFLVFDWETGQYVESTEGFMEGGEATLTQASGRSIARGSAAVVADGAIVCDGQTLNDASATIMASTVPWKKGTAVASVGLHVVDSQFQNADNGQAGPLAVKLTAK